MNLRLSIIHFIMFASISLSGQIGTEFWFAAPEVTSGYSDNPVYLRISTYNQSATVTISQPANNAFAVKTITIAPNSIQSVDLTTDLANIESAPHNSVQNKGLYITSTENISVYYEVYAGGDNPDIFTLKSYNALGQNFVIPAQNYWHNFPLYYPMPSSGFDIVATRDGTTVTIIPKKQLRGRGNPPTPFTINLKRGQTYSCRANSFLSTEHLGGSEVYTNHPVAITIVDDAGFNIAYGTCRDLMGDQIVPAERLGMEYIVGKGYLSNSSGSSLADKIYVTAVHNGTTVQINNGPVVATLNKGDQYLLNLTANTVRIETSEKVYVLHVTGEGCEVATALISPLGCTGLDQFTFTRSLTGKFYLHLLVLPGGQAKFEINGDKNLVKSNDFTTIQMKGKPYKLARVEMDASDIVPGNSYTITNVNNRFHAAIINGDNGNGCVYGYFTDFNIVRPASIYHY